ncbi:MAG: HEPN domain-containing protein [Planctomycetia bacterium]
MKEFIRSQRTKAMRSIAAAEATLDPDPDSAASRPYYAAFHGVTAVLAGRGMEFTKHTAVRAALHRDLIQSGALSADLGLDYDFLLDLRETADYGGVAETSLASATTALKKAKAILAALEPLLPKDAASHA